MPALHEHQLLLHRLHEAFASDGIADVDHQGLSEEGEGVPQDYAKCVHWYAQAAEQGHGASINNLADKYEKGLGVPKDLAKAFALYSIAAEKNIIAAWYSLGCMYQDGRGVAQDKNKARSWLEKAAGYQFSDSVARLLALR